MSAVVSNGLQTFFNYQGAKANEKIEKRNAQIAFQRGSRQAGDIRRRTRALLAKQLAAYAASGVQSTSGTPLDVMSEDAKQGELDAMTALYNGRTQQNAHLTRAAQHRFSAKMALIVGTAKTVQSGLDGMQSSTTVQPMPPVEESQPAGSGRRAPPINPTVTIGGT